MRDMLKAVMKFVGLSATGSSSRRCAETPKGCGGFPELQVPPKPISTSVLSEHSDGCTSTMIKIKTISYDDCTMGRLEFGDFQCFTLELPWKDNQQDVSCIPEGHYKAVRYDSPQHGWVLLLLDVDDREMIEVHPGNFTHQILGCILVGNSIKYLDSDSVPDVTNSRDTLEALLALIEHDVEIDIQRYG